MRNKQKETLFMLTYASCLLACLTVNVEDEKYQVYLSLGAYDAIVYHIALGHMIRHHRVRHEQD
jgi:hypothetical protein